jgi:hypothetical protein
VTHLLADAFVEIQADGRMLTVGGANGGVAGWREPSAGALGRGLLLFGLAVRGKGIDR